MEATTPQTDDVYVITIPEQLNVATSPSLKTTLTDAVSSYDKIELDYSATELVTSAGLRVLLQAQKNVQTSGKSMTMKNVSPDVMEVFDVTGVSKIFTIV